MDTNENSGEIRKQASTTVSTVDTSDSGLAALLERINVTSDPDELRRLAYQIQALEFNLTEPPGGDNLDRRARNSLAATGRG